MFVGFKNPTYKTVVAGTEGGMAAVVDGKAAASVILYRSVMLVGGAGNHQIPKKKILINLIATIPMFLLSSMPIFY